MFQPTQAKWRIVFVICAVIYIICATFYVFCSSGQRQVWDNPDRDDDRSEKKQLDGVQVISETQH